MYAYLCRARAHGSADPALAGPLSTLIIKNCQLNLTVVLFYAMTCSYLLLLFYALFIV